jgi:hypothetical protein
VKLTNLEIFNAKEPLSKLLQEKLPVKSSYGLAKLASKLDPQLGVIEKVRQGLILTYGEKDPNNPQQIMVDPKGENFPKFAEEYGELMMQEVEIVIDVVTLPDTLEVDAATLMALNKFIKI